jgi:hypothetical protein
MGTFVNSLYTCPADKILDMDNELHGFSPEQMASINKLLPAYFEAELAKWMSQHLDKAETHKLVKYPDDTIETLTGVTFRQRYVLLPKENLAEDVALLSFEEEAESFPHTILAVTIENNG